MNNTPDTDTPARAQAALALEEIRKLTELGITRPHLRHYYLRQIKLLATAALDTCNTATPPAASD